MELITAHRFEVIAPGIAGWGFRSSVFGPGPCWSARTTTKQAIQGALRYRDWLVAAPTGVLGDFNDNASYLTTNWPALLEAFEPLGLVSAYHTWTGEAFGQETTSTHFHRRAATSGWHVDYCFAPEVWAPRITIVHVGSHDEWGTLSDHTPVIVDIDLPMRPAD